MLNFIIAEYKNKKINYTLLRTALKLKPPSLYYQTNKNKNIYIASERLDNKNGFLLKITH